MRRTLLLLVTGAAIVVPCAAAQAAANVFSIPVDATVTSCSGEFVDFSGTLQIVESQVLTPGGTVEFVFHDNLVPNSAGVGETSGDSYQVSADAVSSHFAGSFSGTSPEILQETMNFAMRDMTTGVLTHMHLTFHLTVLPSGDFTASVDNVTSSC